MLHCERHRWRVGAKANERRARASKRENERAEGSRALRGPDRRVDGSEIVRVSVWLMRAERGSCAVILCNVN